MLVKAIRVVNEKIKEKARTKALAEQMRLLEQQRIEALKKQQEMDSAKAQSNNTAPSTQEPVQPLSVQQVSKPAAAHSTDDDNIRSFNQEGSRFAQTLERF